MSVLRVFLAAMFGALAGGGAAIALIQSGQLASSTSSVAISAGVAAGFSAASAVLARFRIIKALLIVGAIGLSVATFVMAQTPEADAQEPQSEQCAQAHIGDVFVTGTPAAGTLGSIEDPVRIAVDGESSVSFEIQTVRPFERVMIEVTIVEPVNLQQSRELSSDNIRFENGRATADLEIVKTSTGLSVSVGRSTVPLPFGTVRIEGSFSNPMSRTNDAPQCPFELHVQLVTSALDTLAGRLALGAVAVGALGLIAIALTGGSASAGAAPQPAPRPPISQPAPPSTPQPRPPAPAPPAPAPPAPASPQPPAAAGSARPPARPAPAPAPPAPGPPAPAPPAAAPGPPGPALPAPAPAPPGPALPAPAPPVPTGAAVVTPPLAKGSGGSEPEERAERFVQMRIEADDFPEQGFVAGATNNLSFWIGPEIIDDYVQQASHAVTEAGRTITLDAQFVWPDGQASSSMTLDADPTTRSDPKFEVAVEITADSSRFGGTLYLWVRETNRLYEQVKIVGATGPAGHTDRPHLISIVEDREQIDRITENSTPMGSCVVHQGNSLFWYTNGELAIRDATDVMAVQTSLSATVANLQLASGQVDWTNAAALALLREIAVEGAKLRYAVAGEIEPGNALQFYNQQDKTTVPFEWVYDRGYTAPDAAMKPTCVASLRQGLDPDRSSNDPFPCGCLPASALSADVRFNNPTLCPWGFWGLAKVIERYDTDPTLVNNVHHPDDDQVLPAFSSVLLAVDHTLDLPSGRAGEALVDIAGQLAQTAATRRVDTWQDFRTELASSNGQLIVTLPHQESDTLQIGTDKLHLSQVPMLLSEGHDRIILLLGCRTTQAASVGFASFGRIFKDHASVVVGSSAILVTSDAARLAVELVKQLAEVAATGEPLGRAVVGARQRLFADGFPIALAVTALGDADWRFAARALAPA